MMGLGVVMREKIARTKVGFFVLSPVRTFLGSFLCV